MIIQRSPEIRLFVKVSQEASKFVFKDLSELGASYNLRRAVHPKPPPVLREPQLRQLHGVEALAELVEDLRRWRSEQYILYIVIDSFSFKIFAFFGR